MGKRRKIFTFLVNFGQVSNMRLWLLADFWTMINVLSFKCTEFSIMLISLSTLKYKWALPIIYGSHIIELWEGFMFLRRLNQLKAVWFFFLGKSSLFMFLELFLNLLKSKCLILLIKTRQKYSYEICMSFWVTLIVEMSWCKTQRIKLLPHWAQQNLSSFSWSIIPEYILK